METSNQSNIISLDEIKAQVTKERIEKCQKELFELLKKHKCSLSTIQIWRNGLPEELQISIIPQD